MLLSEKVELFMD